MSLRPRYSLLTLLVLTALVAGGVKLWYGPHRVVERPTPEAESEYTFTRNWCGEKVISGPHICRAIEDSERTLVIITNYRNGKAQNGAYFMTVKYAKQLTLLQEDLEYSSWTLQEDQEFLLAINTERRRFQETDAKVEIREGFWPELDQLPEMVRFR